LLTISGTSGKNGKRTLTELIRNYPKNLNWEEGAENDCITLVRINSILSEIGKRDPDHRILCGKTILRTLKYPIYRPERANEILEDLYKSAARKIQILGKISPMIVKDSSKVFLKIIGDTRTFERWNSTIRKRDSMYSVFRNGFLALTSVAPRYSIAPLARNLDSSNKDLSGEVRRIFLEMGEHPENTTPLLLDHTRHKNIIIRKNISSLMEDILILKSRRNAEILLRSLRIRRNHYVLGAALEGIGIVVDKCGTEIGKNIEIIYPFTTHSNEDVSRSAISTIGNIAVREKKNRFGCTKKLIQALHQSRPMVRLAALSSLQNILEQYKEGRRAVIPHLIELQTDPQETIRWRSSAILKEAGFDNKKITEFMVADNNLKYTQRLIKELEKGSTVDLRDAKLHIRKARKNLKEDRYKRASFYANLARGGVLEMRSKSPPKLDIELVAEKEIISGEANILGVVMTNLGRLHAYNPSVYYPNNVDILKRLPRRIKGEESIRTDVKWTPFREGKIQFRTRISYSDYADYRRAYNKDIWLEVTSPKNSVEIKGKDDSIPDVSTEVQ